MGGFSGKYATAFYDEIDPVSGNPNTELHELTGWDFEPKAAIPKWASNDSNGFKKGVAGVEDSSGKIDGKLDKDNRFSLKPGKEVTLTLYPNKHVTTDKIVVRAIIGNTPVSVKIDPDGEPPTVTYNWEGIAPPQYFGFFRSMEETGSSGIS